MKPRKMSRGLSTRLWWPLSRQLVEPLAASPLSRSTRSGISSSTTTTTTRIVNRNMSCSSMMMRDWPVHANAMRFRVRWTRQFCGGRHTGPVRGVPEPEGAFRQPETISAKEAYTQSRGRQFMSWKMVFWIAGTLTVAAVMYQQLLIQVNTEMSRANVESYGEAEIGGGEWRMFTHNADIATEQTFLGKYQIVYFGFTFCPDVCPRELTKLARCLTILEERGYGDEIVPLFVSVDPKRDSPALVAKFIRQFHPKIVGLTGTPQQVANFAKAYKAYYSTPGPGEDNKDDYIIDHVTMMYIMGRNGEYEGHVSTLENSAEMAEKIIQIMKDVKVSGSGGFLGKLFNRPSDLIKDGPPKKEPPQEPPTTQVSSGSSTSSSTSTSS